MIAWFLNNKTTALGLVALAAFIFVMGQSKLRGVLLAQARQSVAAFSAAIAARDDSHGRIVRAFEQKETDDEDRKQFTDEAFRALDSAGGSSPMDPALRAAYERVYIRRQKAAGGQILHGSGQHAAVPRP